MKQRKERHEEGRGKNDYLIRYLFRAFHRPGESRPNLEILQENLGIRKMAALSQPRIARLVSVNLFL